MSSFEIQGKKVDVFPAAGSDSPLICLNIFMREGEKVYKEMQKIGSPDCSVVAISGMDWNHDMAPWDCPPLSKTDTPCTPGADDYLDLLLHEILPKAEEQIKGEPVWRAITGYSLAGLFAVYAIYRTDAFSRIASMSGSLWFPDFKEYVFSHDMKIRPDCAYFSLGDKESNSRNKFLKTTQTNTGEIQKFYEEQGIDSIFVLNPGNHYVNPMKRMAAGLDWILRR